MGGASELWYVQLSDGDVHRVTVDQLDEGFQAGHIDGNTMVLPAGATHWAKLGEIAGIDEVASAPTPLPRPALVVLQPPSVVKFAVAPPMIESHRPVSVDLSDLDFIPEVPRRSRKGWIVGMLGVATLGALAGVGLERPSLFKMYALHAGAHVAAAKSWLVDAVPRLGRQAAAPPAATVPSPTVEASMLTPPTTATPPAEPTAAPAASPATSLPEPSASESTPPPRGAGSKARARKAHPKVAGSTGAQRPPAFTTKGSKFDPLSSSIQ
jgi:hypothetical protein